MGAPQQASLGDIGVATPGKKLIVETDRAISVGVNDSTKLWPISSILVMASDGITSLWFQNTDATNTATVTFLVTD